MKEVVSIFDMISGVFGGLAVFLLGMKYMSDGMQAIAGSRLRRMIAAVTDNRFLACASGATVTAVIQSSSVTTVMLVGMVNAGVMTLMQAIGVILGADLGTTITAWIVALKITKYGLPLLGGAAFVFLFARTDKVRFRAMAFMGVGMIFFGLSLMKHGLEPLREMQWFVDAFSRFQPDSYFGVIKCVLAGALVTAVVQSSSATVAITITLARADLIGFDAAVALVLGENIGTTITAYLASLGATSTAKRVAYAHVLIKAAGVSLMIPFFFLYIRLLRGILPEELDVAKKIAVTHTLFNCGLVCVFLPLRTVIGQTLLKLFPDKPKKETPHLTVLDVRLVETPSFGIQQSGDEVSKMGVGVQKMLSWVRELSKKPEADSELVRKVFHREEVLDQIQKEVVEFITHLLGGNVPHELALETRRQLRIADEYESISDYLAGILKLHLKLHKEHLDLSQDELGNILNLHDQVDGMLAYLHEALQAGNPDVLSRARTASDMINHSMKTARDVYVKNMEEGRMTPLKGVVYIDILQSYRKIKDHAVNIAETMGGEK